jgi:hypothetical protein
MTEPNDLARLYLSPRAKSIGLVESYVLGTQYVGRVPWFDASSNVPLFERAPCIKYPIVATAIASHVAFVLGEGRWPTLSSGTSEDDGEIDEDWGLPLDQSEALDRFVNVVLVKHARVKETARELLGEAMGSRSCGVVLSVRAGRLCAETVKPAWCTPTLDDNEECAKLEIRYPYIESFYNEAEKKWDERCMLYRRAIDATTDTVYQPAKAKEDGSEPDWVEDTAKTKAHGLGFCPVIWYPFMKPCSVATEVDGVALHERQLEEVDCLNIALSQKQRASVVAGDPQIVETGVATDHNPAPMGAVSRGVIVKKTDASDRSVSVFSSTSNAATGRKLARMRGSGVVWTYPAADAKVYTLTLPEGALAAIDDHAKDIRNKLSEAFFAVFLDPNEARTHGAISGKAMAFMFSRQLGFCDQVRDDFGDKALIPLVSMLLRIVYVIGKKNPTSLYMPGVKKVLPILESFDRETADENGATTTKRTWVAPRLEPQWGPYFPPGEQDQLFVVQLAAQAKDAGIATTTMCVEKLRDAGVFNVSSAEEVVKGIDDERATAAQEAMDQVHATAAALNGPEKKLKPGKMNGAAEAA